jgi:hypothetical protein
VRVQFLEVLDLLDIYPWITKFQIILTVRVQFLEVLDLIDIIHELPNFKLF